MQHLLIFGTTTHEAKIDRARGQNDNRGNAEEVLSRKPIKQRGQTRTP